jgi:hypothetical protein
MARWAIVTVVLYIVMVAIFVVPVAWWLVDKATGQDATGIYLFGITSLTCYWQAWLALGIILLAQLLMLIFPVRAYAASPVPTRAIWVPVLTTGVLLLILLIGLSGSVLAAIWGDDQTNLSYGIWISVLVLGSWVIWAGVFYCFGRAQDMPAFVQRLSKWLVKGSIVELLVAVPCHIIVRHRNDCCAPGITFFGIAAGLAIMAIAFGPSVLILANTRIRQMHGTRSTAR